jgi:serine/threonine-protein kinase
MIGETINQYKILEELGRGGMGIVYKAQDTKLDRTVALKFLPEYLSSDQNEKERFYHEARSAAALNHQNIAVIYEISEHENKIFIAMEYLEGRTIKDLVEKESDSLTIKKVLETAIQIAEGLAAAHEKGIVHRDIKSDNIILTPKGKIKIMDFGLAKLKGASRLTQAGSTVGTAAYMSPEQAQGEDVDHRSDIFSFGVVLYELLTAHLPFRGEHQAALVYSVVNENPQPIARFNDKVTPELERIVDKALSKDKDERYQHVDDMLADLRREWKNIEYAKASHVSSPALQVETQKPNENFRRFYIPASILILLVIAAAAYFLFFKQGSEINSIAVLPFSITSSDSSANILSDGITEGIINSLSSIPSLTVMSRNSVFRYAGENVDVKEVGKKLDVKAVLLGRITQSGDSYAISVELVDAGNERHLWGAQYKKHASDIFSLQGEVSKDISEQLRVKLSGKEEKRLSRNYTENSEAYTLYLKGRFYLNKRTEEGLRKSIDYFNQAIGKDPNYALAYVGLSDGYSLLVDNYYIPADDGYPKAKAAILKALALDDELAEAHTSLANIFGVHELNNTESIREYKKAIELNPNYAEAHHWYALQLNNFGKFDEALHEIKRALQADPLYLRINQNVGFIYYSLRQYDKCIEWQQKTIDMDSTFPGPHALMGDAYFMKKQYNKALQSYEEETRLTGDKTTIFYSACVYGVTGQTAKASKLLDELKQLSEKTYVPTSYFMFIQLYLGNTDKAIALLQKAVDEKDAIISYLLVEPKLDPLRSDPRFTELLRKTKFIQ